MLAMTLLSVMVVLLFASLRIAAQSWDAGEEKIIQVNDKAVVYQFFKRHLTTVLPLWDDFSDQGRRFSFQGERDTLQFVSVFPASAGRKGLQVFEIGADRNEKDMIMVKLTPFYPTIDNQAWEPEEVSLLRGVDSFEFSYYDVTEETRGWVDEWLDKDKLPQLIKIKINLLDESYWPEMVFAPRLAEVGSDDVVIGSTDDNLFKKGSFNTDDRGLLWGDRQ